MIQILGLFFIIVLAGCSHTINIRASHFASPITGDTQWSGHIAGVGALVTKVTLINNIETNPPTRTEVLINQDADALDLVLFNNIGFDASLTIFKGIDLYLDNSMPGFRYQFLNHGASTQNWVASIQGAFGQRSESTSNDSSGNTPSDTEAKSKITTRQAGISLGYKLEHIVPYFSYIYEAHEVKTDVTNSNGSFGPYDDKGNHQYYTLGFATHTKGLNYGIEYNFITIDWERAASLKTQNSWGFKLGYAW